MWFLYFWAISTVATLLLGFIVGKAVRNKIKREYKVNADKRPKASLSEMIIRTLPAFAPFFNCVLVLIYVFAFDTLYKRIVERWQATGFIEVKNVIL